MMQLTERRRELRASRLSKLFRGKCHPLLWPCKNRFGLDRNFLACNWHPCKAGLNTCTAIPVVRGGVIKRSGVLFGALSAVLNAGCCPARRHIPRLLLEPAPVEYHSIGLNLDGKLSLLPVATRFSRCPAKHPSLNPSVTPFSPRLLPHTHTQKKKGEQRWEKTLTADGYIRCPLPVSPNFCGYLFFFKPDWMIPKKKEREKKILCGLRSDEF